MVGCCERCNECSCFTNTKKLFISWAIFSVSKWTPPYGVIWLGEKYFMSGSCIKWLTSVSVLCRWRQYIGRKCTYYEENSEALVVASMETGLEVNGDKTKYMVMSRDQNAGRSRNINNDNKNLKWWNSSNMGTTVTNQNSMQEESKSRLKSGNACYH